MSGSGDTFGLGLGTQSAPLSAGTRERPGQTTWAAGTPEDRGVEAAPLASLVPQGGGSGLHIQMQSCVGRSRSGRTGLGSLHITPSAAEGAVHSSNVSNIM